MKGTDRSPRWTRRQLLRARKQDRHTKPTQEKFFFGWLDALFAKRVRLLERSPLIQIAAVGIVLFTVYQLWVDLQDRKDQREFLRQEIADRQEERIDRAWERLYNEKSSSHLLVKSLNHLFEQGENISGLTISCHGIGFLQGLDKTCDDSIWFRSNVEGIDLRGQDSGWGLGKTQLGRLIVRGKDIASSNFDNIEIELERAVDTFWFDVAFNDVLLNTIDEAEIGHFEIHSSIFLNSNAHIARSEGGEGIFEDSNLSGSRATLKSVADVDAFGNISSRGNWAWADTPPLIYKSGYPYAVARTEAATAEEIYNFLEIVVTLYEPPTTADGQIVLLEKRDNKSSSRDQNRTVSVDAASKLYPEAYSRLIEEQKERTRH